MPNYNFRGYIYITLDIAVGIGIFKVYLDNNCLITLINRSKFLNILLDAEIKRMLSTIKIRGITNAIYNSSDYTLVKLRVSN